MSVALFLSVNDEREAKVHFYVKIDFTAYTSNTFGPRPFPRAAILKKSFRVNFTRASIFPIIPPQFQLVCLERYEKVVVREGRWGFVVMWAEGWGLCSITRVDLVRNVHRYIIDVCV